LKERKREKVFIKEKVPEDSYTISNVSWEIISRFKENWIQEKELNQTE